MFTFQTPVLASPDPGSEPTSLVQLVYEYSGKQSFLAKMDGNSMGKPTVNQLSIGRVEF